MRFLTLLSLVLVGAHLLLSDAGPLRAAFHGTFGWWGAATIGVVAGCAVGRRWGLTAVAATPLAIWCGAVVPGTLRATGAPVGATLRLVSANVLMVNPDPDALLAEVFANAPDLVVLEEYSPRFADRAARYRVSHPYTVEDPQEHSFGTAVFSRLPLRDVGEVDLAGVPMTTFSVTVDGRPVRVFVVHTLPPISATNVDGWRAQLAALADVAADEGALVVAGDLNATRHHPSFRALLRDGGLRDAHAEVGRAAAWTWPNGLWWLPALQLDHVLLRGAVSAVSVVEGTGTGSDHRPLIVDLRIR